MGGVEGGGGGKALGGVPTAAHTLSWIDVAYPRSLQERKNMSYNTQNVCIYKMMYITACTVHSQVLVAIHHKTCIQG